MEPFVEGFRTHLLGAGKHAVVAAVRCHTLRAEELHPHPLRRGCAMVLLAIDHANCDRTPAVLTPLFETRQPTCGALAAEWALS